MSTEVTFTQRVESIKDCVPSRFHLHEGYLQNALEFETRAELDSFILRVEKGGSGSKIDNTWVDNPDPYNVGIDLRTLSTDNTISLHYFLWGRKAIPANLVDPSKDVLCQSGRWFAIGKHNADSKLIKLSDQVEVIQYVVGVHKALDEYKVIKQRRQEQWKYWATGDSRGNDFQLCDLPILAHYFRDLWATPFEYEIESDGILTAKTLEGIKKEIVELLVCSFVIAPTEDQSFICRHSKRRMTAAVAEDTNVDERWIDSRRRVQMMVQMTTRMTTTTTMKLYYPLKRMDPRLI